MQKSLCIAGVVEFLATQRLIVVNIDGLEEALLHHCCHNVTLVFAKEFPSMIDILRYHNICIIVYDVAFYFIARTGFYATIALESI